MLKTPERHSDFSAAEVLLKGKKILQLLTKRRIATLLTCGALAGMCAPQDSSKRPNSSVVAEAPDKQLVFNPEAYQPPKEGQIWKSEIYDPETVTIIYVPDHHSREYAPENWPVQKEIFAIVEDAIQKYGKVPVLNESWTDYGDDQYNFRRNLKEKKLSELASNTYLDARKADAMGKMDSGFGMAGELLVAVHPSKVIPVPSRDQQEELIDNYTSRQYYSLIHSVQDLPGEVNCNFLDKLNVLLPSVQETIFPNVQPEKNDCVCMFDALYYHAYDVYKKHRGQIVPEREVTRAAQVNAPFVFVVVGRAHLPHSLEIMEKRKLNHIVVFPTSLPAKDNFGLADLERQKSCQQWYEEHTDEIRAAVQGLGLRFAIRAKRMQKLLNKNTPR